jgi:soluble lytic murein transglycosylase-like protein
MRLRYIPLIFFVLALSAATCAAQVYSYLDQNGVRVFTNIPPAAPVADLKITGAPPAPPPPATKAAAAKTKVTAAKPASGNSAKQAASSQSTQKTISIADRAPAEDAGQNPVGYSEIIEKYAAAYKLDPKLIQSMIATESAFNSKAVSPKGAQGLMQLMPGTATRMGVRNPFNPEENISGGTKYMRFLMDTFSYAAEEDQLVLSLAAYNAGENLVQKLGRVPPIRETAEYVSSILQRYGKKIMDEVANEPPRIPGPSTFDYLDDSGVRVFTNIPPVIPIPAARLDIR